MLVERHICRTVVLHGAPASTTDRMVVAIAVIGLTASTKPCRTTLCFQIHKCFMVPTTRMLLLMRRGFAHPCGLVVSPQACCQQVGLPMLTGTRTKAMMSGASGNVTKALRSIDFVSAYPDLTSRQRMLPPRVPPPLIQQLTCVAEDGGWRKGAPGRYCTILVRLG